MYVHLAALNDVDKLVGIADSEQILPGRNGHRLNGLAELEEDGFVKVSKHVETVEKVAELRRDPARLRGILFLFEILLGRASEDATVRGAILGTSGTISSKEEEIQFFFLTLAKYLWEEFDHTNPLSK